MAKQQTNSGTAARIPLSRERILLAALRLADEGNLESLSMRKLAQTLGIKAMSLYNHVNSRDDIVDGLVDRVVSEIELPTIGADWQAAMRRRAISAHEVLLRHPWATMALMSRMNVGPAMLCYVNATLGCLKEAGFSYEMADHAWNAIDSHIYGFTLQALNFPLAPAEYPTVAAAYLPNLPIEKYPYLNQLTQQVIKGHYSGLHDFELGLALLLTGLEQFRDKGS
jgi:AcrR family transcriptional regulator